MITTGRKPGRRDSMASRETTLMAEYKNRGKSTKCLIGFPMPGELTTSIKVMRVVFCYSVIMDKLHRLS